MARGAEPRPPCKERGRGQRQAEPFGEIQGSDDLNSSPGSVPRLSSYFIILSVFLISQKKEFS